MITKKDLVEAIQEDMMCGCKKPSKADIETYLDAVFRVIANKVVIGETVRIQGFGTFSSKEVKGKIGVLNNKKFETEDSRKPVFKAGDTFKRDVAETVGMN